MKHVAAGVAYENPTHYLDVANYVKEAWQSMSSSSIKSSFVKAELMKFEADKEKMNKIEYLVTKVTQPIAALNLSIGQEEIKDLFTLMKIVKILDHVEELLETMKTAEENLDDRFDYHYQDSDLNLRNNIAFK